MSKTTDDILEKTFNNQSGVCIPKVEYFLLGEEASKIYHNEGILELAKHRHAYAYVKFEHGVNSFSDVMDEALGWYAYDVITKEDYEYLEKLDK